MSIRGRKPLPNALHSLHGNPGHRARNDAEPRFAAGPPTCPPHLKGEARKEWRRVVKEFEAHAGYCKGVDRAALAVYCQHYARWIEAERMLEDAPPAKTKAAESVSAADSVSPSDSVSMKPTAELRGVIITAPSGYPIQNPWLAVANKAMREMMRVAVEFGMTPSSRSRINVPEGEGEPSDKVADMLFGARGRRHA